MSEEKVISFNIYAGLHVKVQAHQPQLLWQTQKWVRIRRNLRRQTARTALRRGGTRPLPVPGCLPKAGFPRRGRGRDAGCAGTASPAIV